MKQDKNLLFGVIAVQMGFVNHKTMIDASSIWASNQEKELSLIFLENDWIKLEEKEIIEKLIEVQIKKQGKVSKVLNSLGGTEAVHKSFAGSIMVTDSGQVLPSLGGTAESTAADTTETDLTNKEKLTIQQPGRYTIMGEKGRGGIGKVLLAFDSHLGREIAVKELIASEEGVIEDKPTPVSKTAAMVARFLTEARITGQLEHPSIVPVYEIGKKPDGSIYYTMKLVKGATLADKIRAEDTLETRLELLENYISLCNAIAYAHSRGVIHRDIKPQNIMIGEFGETVVLDWGLAKLKGREDKVAGKLKAELEGLKDIGGFKTIEGRALGTPSYMPPEQAEGKLKEIDERSDIYSLGAVLYEILTGHPPFTGDTAYEIVGKVLNEKPQNPKTIDHKIPEELNAICMKALNKKRKDRYSSAKELAEDIKRFMTGSLVSAYEYNPIEKLKKWASNNKLVVMTAAVGLSVLFLFSIFMYVSISQKQEKSEKALAQVFYELGERSELEEDYKKAFYYYSHSYLTFPIVIPDKDPSVKKMLEMSNRILPEKKHLFSPRILINTEEHKFVISVFDFETNQTLEKSFDFNCKLFEISNDERRIIACDDENTIYVFDDKLNILGKFKSEENIDKIYISEGGLCAGLKSKNILEVYDLESFSKVFSADNIKSSEHIIFSPDSKYLFYYNDKFETIGINLENGKTKFKFESSILTSISDDSKYIVLSEFSKRKVKILELSSGKRIYSSNCIKPDYNKQKRINPINNYFYYINLSGFLKIYNLRKKTTRTIEVRGFFPNLQYNTDVLLFSRKELVKYLEKKTGNFRIKDSIYPQSYLIANYVEKRKILYLEYLKCIRSPQKFITQIKVFENPKNEIATYMILFFVIVFYDIRLRISKKEKKKSDCVQSVQMITFLYWVFEVILIAFLFYADKTYYSMNIKVVLMLINPRILLFLFVLICFFIYLIHIFGKYNYDGLSENKFVILFLFSQITMYAYYLLTIKFSYFEDAVQKTIISVGMYSKFLYLKEVIIFLGLGLILILLLLKCIKLIINYKKQAVWKEILISLTGNIFTFFSIVILLGYFKYILKFENIL
ncbi:protein kinase [Candidatus Dependentiae bacterium]|nr:protein kinase [Candidatus Dependentiae bacterium]